MAEIVDILGIGGVFSMLLAYYLLQREKVQAHSPKYLWMNFLGGLAVLISLCFHWNLPAFVMELAWVAISGHSIFFAKGTKQA